MQEWQDHLFDYYIKQIICSPSLRLLVGVVLSLLVVLSLHPVSITRFPLTRLSPGAGLLSNRLFHRQRLRFSRGWVRKDGNLLTETGCIMIISRSSTIIISMIIIRLLIQTDYIQTDDCHQKQYIVVLLLLSLVLLLVLLLLLLLVCK